MTPDLFRIPGPWRGQLAIATRPRGGDWLLDEAHGWRDAGIEVVVSLLEGEEAAELGLGNEAETVESVGMRFVSFPIQDRDVPSGMTATQNLLRQLKDDLAAGRYVAVHCRQSIGRSSLIAVGALVAAGLDVEQAIQNVGAARGLTVPETPEQLDWLRRLASEHFVTTWPGASPKIVSCR